MEARLNLKRALKITKELSDSKLGQDGLLLTHKLSPHDELLLETLDSGELEARVYSNDQAYGHGRGIKHPSLEHKALRRVADQELEQYFEEP